MLLLLKINLDHEFKNVTWKGPYFSDVITEPYIHLELEKLEKLFLTKSVFFSDENVIITNTCKYKYVAKKRTPIEIWKSNKAVDFYRLFLTKYSINIDNAIYEVLTENDEESCEYPFSELMIIDNTIIFFEDHRAIFYFSLSDERNNQDIFKIISSENKKITLNSFDLLIKDQYKNMYHGDSICKNIEIPAEELSGYESMTGCFFKGMNIAESYLKYKTNNDGLPKKSLTIRT
ncbi:hypothetical protein Xmau_00162 [Xenorhabdus mauleonii]|uniref:Uncharacterized protein n=1 Tax=Xenorhabdus mauleonii TaxID=351675 RepID=A0A1I3N6U4_9GAMM|nr:hypothetical protein [Xenorhabdus mauleonii]PHM45774.1 hypothetical protein Xmau_00162 [Xenorhabdus mauleonii]SFJ04576.1 hypothetical protein SAMN05421680_10598 [Xenorhabdus mauleonii]